MRIDYLENSKFLLAVSFLFLPGLLFSQTASTDLKFNAAKEYIEILPGNMPLVISIPHGGYLVPDEIPERPCTNCAKHQDTLTIEIGLAVRNEIFKKTGLYPYVIINNLHRTRLDPNRNIAEAADGNKNSALAWTKFQSSIDSANAQVMKRFGKGLYIDLHGHRHAIERCELGYLLSNEELQLEDDLLNSESFAEYSSIRNLIGHNLHSSSYSELVRGKYSLGTLMEEKGYPSVPSLKHPFPKPEDPYFSGGYNTSRHGSSTGGTIDGIQIELDEVLRTDDRRRGQLAVDLATVLIDFLKIHYFPDFDFTPGR
jgi:N-formylglutamate amidohydrolase